MRYVYVMESASGLVKIGTSKNINTRRKNLENQSGFGIKVAAQFGPFSSATNLERMAHESLSAYRMSGEWFAVKAVVAISTLENLVKSFVDSNKVRRDEPTQSISAAERHLTCIDDGALVHQTAETLYANGMGSVADSLIQSFNFRRLGTRDFMHECQLALMERKFFDLLKMQTSFRYAVQMYLRSIGI